MQAYIEIIKVVAEVNMTNYGDKGMFSYKESDVKMSCRYYLYGVSNIMWYGI